MSAVVRATPHRFANFLGNLMRSGHLASEFASCLPASFCVSQKSEICRVVAELFDCFHRRIDRFLRVVIGFDVQLSSAANTAEAGIASWQALGSHQRICRLRWETPTQVPPRPNSIRSMHPPRLRNAVGQGFKGRVHTLGDLRSWRTAIAAISACFCGYAVTPMETALT